MNKFNDFRFVIFSVITLTLIPVNGVVIVLKKRVASGLFVFVKGLEQLPIQADACGAKLLADPSCPL